MTSPGSRFSGESSPESLGQQILRVLGNVGFAFLVIGVLVLTVIAVTYQPSDPWLQPSKIMEQVFTKVENATFATEGSLVITGEDAQAPVLPDSMAPAAISLETIDQAESSLQTGGAEKCDTYGVAINCSDPGVIIAIEKANIEKFPEILMFGYRTPVQGIDKTHCDVAWKYKPKKEKSRRMYRDYRSYDLVREENCTYSVIEIGDWHSGKNAQKQRFKGVDVYNDTVVIVPETMNSFRKGKYLYYSQSADYCKGMSHYTWSFLCALGEAQYLNRTLVVDLGFCLSEVDNPGHKDEPGKDFRFYFDFDHLKESSAMIEHNYFIKEWDSWDKSHRRDHIPVRVVDDFRTTPMELREDKTTIIWRKFEQPEADNNYWYRVCEGETEKVIQRPWHLLWKSKRLMNIVNSISGEMEWDFDSVHVVRGDKATNKELWPNLDRDTSPEVLLNTLSGQIDEQRYLYISTNELQPGYFDKLKEKFTVKVLDDFNKLWSPNSEWYNETLQLTGGHEVEFDGYMRSVVDTEVFLRGKKQIETFNGLTKDCKDGVNTC